MHEKPLKNSKLPDKLRKAGALLAIASVGIGSIPADAAANTMRKESRSAKLTQLIKERQNSHVLLGESAPEASSASADIESHHEHHKPVKHHKPEKHHHHPKKHHKPVKHHPKKHPAPPEVQQPAPLINLNPENLSSALTPEVLNAMESNAVFIPNLNNCSGWLLRNQESQPVGILTAKHCGLLPADGNLSTDKTGQQVYNLEGPIIAYTGNTPGNSTTPSDMQPMGQVTSFYVDMTNTNDLAVGVFSGQDPQQVLEIAQSELMPAGQSSSLPEGTVVFERSMPQYQPNNTGPEEMQNFAMSILGSANWSITDAVAGTNTTLEQLNVEVAAVPLSQDGSECSPGASGSAAFMLGANGEPQLIGIQSAYNDWGRLYTASNPTQAQANLNYYQTTYNTDLSSYSAVCGFSQALPTAATGAQFIPVNP